MTSLPERLRPLVWEDVVGQPMVVSYLSELIRRGQVAKNVIIEGPFGSGKTTGARIYARALNCASPTESGSPCNQCLACLDHLQELHTDSVEIDGATFGGVEAIRQFRELALQPPLYGRYRVITIDECQGLSPTAWDVLLKVVESPPPFVSFIFTTTEVEKVDQAIRSRCQILGVEVLDAEGSGELLDRAAAELERGDPPRRLERSAYPTLIHLARGHPRDLIKMVDHASYLGDVTEGLLVRLFGLDYADALAEWLRLLADEDGRELQSHVASWPEEPSRAHAHMVDFLLWLHYRVVLGWDASPDPLLDRLDRDEMERRVEALVAPTHHSDDPGLVLVALLNYLQGMRVESLTALLVASLTCHSFIHQHRGHAAAIGTIPDLVRSTTAVSRKARTQRIGHEPLLNGSPDPAVPDPVQAPVAEEAPADEPLTERSEIPLSQFNLLGFRKVVDKLD